MGCGQSKINLYPRRNKSGGKANGAKKSGAADKEADDEDGAGGAGGGAAGATAADDDVTDDDADKGKHLLPLSSHAAVIEVSASQQDFFKMLDDKIDKGKDYDSSSETEVRAERERRMRLIREWQSKSQSSSQSQPSPPTPARRRPPPPRPDRERTASPRRLCSQQLASPPPRRCHSAQGQHASQYEHDKKNPVNGGRDWQEHNSPVRRPQSAGPNWKGNPKVAPYCQKVNKNGACNSDEATYQSEASESGPDSQITYNPTFQTHSPAHVSQKNSPQPQQPYIAQIVTYPTINQAPPNAYISPPETYQESSPLTAETPKYANVPRQVTIPPVQSNIYYIHGNPRQPSPDQILTQKQQTALHLQHYVAMKQAQQNMFGYLQRMPQGVYPGPDFSHQAADLRTFDSMEESYGVAYYAGLRAPQRPRSAPPSNNNVSLSTAAPQPPTNVVNPLVGMSPLVNQVSMFSHITPVMPPFGQFPPGQFPQTEVQYYHQAQLMQNMYRPGSAGSAGTLTRYPAKDKHCVAAPIAAVDGTLKTNECQSINIVRQKPVGQIVSLGGQDLGVYQNANEKPLVSPGSGSGGSVSSGADSSGGGSRPPTSAPALVQRAQLDGPNQKCTIVNATVEKTKKSNGSTLKTRTKIFKNSKSVDSKKD